jgi:hypothetical protein
MNVSVKRPWNIRKSRHGNSPKWSSRSVATCCPDSKTASGPMPPVRTAVERKITTGTDTRKSARLSIVRTRSKPPARARHVPTATAPRRTTVPATPSGRGSQCMGCETPSETVTSTVLSETATSPTMVRTAPTALVRLIEDAPDSTRGRRRRSRKRTPVTTSKRTT